MATAWDRAWAAAVAVDVPPHTWAMANDDAEEHAEAASLIAVAVAVAEAFTVELELWSLR